MWGPSKIDRSERKGDDSRDFPDLSPASIGRLGKLMRTRWTCFVNVGSVGRILAVYELTTRANTKTNGEKEDDSRDSTCCQPSPAAESHQKGPGRI